MQRAGSVFTVHSDRWMYNRWNPNETIGINPGKTERTGEGGGKERDGESADRETSEYLLNMSWIPPEAWQWTHLLIQVCWPRANVFIWCSLYWSLMAALGHCLVLGVHRFLSVFSAFNFTGCKRASVFSPWRTTSAKCSFIKCWTMSSLHSNDVWSSADKRGFNPY